MRHNESKQEPDRVRAHSSQAANYQIDEATRESVRSVSQGDNDEAAIRRRIRELDREWDIERMLELTASALALSGLTLGVTTNRKWLVVPGIVLPFLLQHAVHGWCPPLPVFRRMGVRSREEIDREKYALKALRGDFKQARDTESALDSVVA